MIRRPPRSTHCISSAASDVYKRQGAYCSRLCQRVIQHNDAPLILTGASALNKVLGREVYTSNAQIGGPKVMANNGVSHMVVPDDVRGVSNILRWLSFVPAKKGAPLPFTLPKGDGFDTIHRPVGFTPANAPHDPREMLQHLSLIHISEPTRQEAISYAVFCLKKKKSNIS